MNEIESAIIKLNGRLSGMPFDLGTIYLTSSPTPQCRLECLLICGKCRAAFSWEACGASV